MKIIQFIKGNNLWQKTYNRYYSVDRESRDMLSAEFRRIRIKHNCKSEKVKTWFWNEIPKRALEDLNNVLDDYGVPRE